MTMTEDGLVTLRSAHSVKDTIDRFESSAKSKGMTIFACIDHAAGAKNVGLELRPTVLLIFGSAKAGTPLMQSRQAMGIDLPLKALAWEDPAGDVWLSYNDPAWLAARHGLTNEGGDAIKAMAAALAMLAKQATSG